MHHGGGRRTFWTAFFAGDILPPDRVADAVRARSDVPGQSMRYWLGFWLHPTRPIAILEGCDAGVSIRSVHDPASDTTHTVIANTTEGAWPLARHLDERLTPP